MSRESRRLCPQRPVEECACICLCLFYLFVPYLKKTFETPMVQCSLFVLKVPLSTNQPTVTTTTQGITVLELLSLFKDMLHSNSAFLVTLRAKLSGAVYCNRSCLFVC